MRNGRSNVSSDRTSEVPVGWVVQVEGSERSEDLMWKRSSVCEKWWYQ